LQMNYAACWKLPATRWSRLMHLTCTEMYLGDVTHNQDHSVLGRLSLDNGQAATCMLLNNNAMIKSAETAHTPQLWQHVEAR